MTDSMITTAQAEMADRIIANLTEDGRFAGRVWAKAGRCRIYIDEYGYIAIGQDGRVYPELRRYRGNIARAAGLRELEG